MRRDEIYNGFEVVFLTFFLILVSILLDTILAIPLMLAWNYTMTYIFDLPAINYLHALCLLTVLTILWKISVVSTKK